MLGKVETLTLHDKRHGPADGFTLLGHHVTHHS